MELNVQFGSDNHSNVHPGILKAIETANKGYTIAYGEDKYTEKAVEKFKKIFGKQIKVYFVYTGTAANILSLKTITKSYNSIICPETAHLNVHECCGPEKFTGCKIQTIPTKNGKLTPNLIKPHITGLGDVHMAQPKVISITQPTEYGTTYTTEELKKLSDFAHNKKMILHVDGARLSNAATYLNKNMKQITKDVGVDVLSFGGTKNGMMIGEAVVFFDKNLSKDFDFYRKQGMQLSSKMRYISVQFNAFFENDLWLKNAKHANTMAKFLEKELRKIPSIEVTQKVEANMVFATFPKKTLEKIREKYYFHVFREEINEARLMCSYNTKKQDIIDFVKTVKKYL